MKTNVITIFQMENVKRKVMIRGIRKTSIQVLTQTAFGLESICLLDRCIL